MPNYGKKVYVTLLDIPRHDKVHRLEISSFGKGKPKIYSQEYYYNDLNELKPGKLKALDKEDFQAILDNLDIVQYHMLIDKDKDLKNE